MKQPATLDSYGNNMARPVSDDRQPGLRKMATSFLEADNGHESLVRGARR